MVISQELRGRDIGTKMMRDAEKWAKNNGFNNLFLQSSEAVGFYLKLGYKIIKEKTILQKDGNNLYSLYKII